MLKPGDKAPDFAVPDSDMQMIKLQNFIGNQNLVLYFYPKDDTPGCTIEALEFTDLEDEFTAKEALVVGVSRDSCVSHGAFRDKHGLTVQLLADIEGELCEAYGVWREKEKNGEKKMGIVRSTFIIDKQGLIKEAMYDVKPKGHAQAVMDLL